MVQFSGYCVLYVLTGDVIRYTISNSILHILYYTILIAPEDMNCYIYVSIKVVLLIDFT